MSKILHRNGDGNVDIKTEEGTIHFHVPDNRSALGVLGYNAVYPNGDYREDGWVYIDDKPVRKWFVNVERVRVWEPRLTDLNSLYTLYKRAEKSLEQHWSELADILAKIWAKAGKGTEVVKAHCIPTHNFKWDSDSQPWWEFSIRQYRHEDGKEGNSFSFDWLDEKPKRVLNRKLGEALYKMEQYVFGGPSPRFAKVRDVFYAAMKRSLPRATESKVICLKFGEESFWFYTVKTSGGGFQWNMFDDRFKFEIRDILNT